ncbi:NACHT domain-containing protein [Micromonospora halophytica]|uniref:NACHT domain-containing protein n=1 Tax=Micromonospora halophytica TaxID=47864 RepID=A0A1C5I9T8_9ACTN|nr:NACHT domain-containing protein [Micromonospora halophytica]SCG54516.1 NACHT domain-containing protein [Micromonospora halophytica]
MHFPDPVETAAQKLGRVVLAQWRHEAAVRGLQDPVPIPVRWRTAPSEKLGDHLHLTGDPVDGSAADLGSFASAFLRLRQRRLVILGGAGSGKTTLAVLLVIELLQRMRVGHPVPVLLSLASWRPRVEHLITWLERQLLREYPYLCVETVRVLIQDRRVLPVLDGLDELPAAERPAAMRALNSVLAAGGPLVLTCRTDDYAEAINSASVLRSAAVVQAEPLAAEAVSEYLLECATPLHQDRWQPLTDALTRDPSSPVAKVLSVPLLLWLCRVVYERATPDRLPGELADPRSFPTAEMIERHLLQALVPSVYPGGPQPPAQPDRNAPRGWSSLDGDRGHERVSRWFGYLAQHLGQRRKPDLAWWELGTAMRPLPRMIVVGLASGACLGLTVWLVDFLLYMLTYADPSRGLMPRLTGGLVFGFVDGLVNGIPAALAFMLIHGWAIRGTALEPSRVRIRIRGRTGQSDVRSLSEILARARIGLMAGFAAGAGIGFLFGLGNALQFRNAVGLVAGLTTSVVFGVAFALGGGLAGGLMAWTEAPVDIEAASDPRGLLDLNRRTVFFQWLTIGPLFGLVTGLGVGVIVKLLNGSLWGVTLVWTFPGGLRFGFLTALGGGLGAVLSLTAWGQWVVLARIWLPLTRRLPWRVMTFLEDAHQQRGVLRQAGAFYQFRHSRLQDHFARPPEHRDQ